MVLEIQNPSTKSNIVVILLGCTLGTFLEFYSLSLIAYFHDQVANAFFPHASDPTIELLQSFTLVGVAFVARPFGGLYFGYYGDKHGRVNALRLSILLMGFPTFFIGCTPTFSMIGYWSTAIVFILRFIQGFASGGEMSSAFVYIMEEASAQRKGLYIMIMYVLGVGDVLALLSYKLLSSGIMAQDSFYSWGFRIPFFLSLLIVFAAVYVRYLLPYTQDFEIMRDNEMILTNPLKYALKHNLREIFVVSIALVTNGLLYHLSSKWVVAYLYEIKKNKHAYDIALGGFFCLIPLAIFGGWLCDKYNAYVVTMCGGLLSLILTFVPLTWYGFTSDPTTVSILQVVEGLSVPCMLPVIIWSALYLSDPRTRSTIFGFAYNIGMALIVSVSFDICTGLQSTDKLFGATYVGLFICTFVLLSLAAVYFGNKYPYRYNYDIITTSDNDKLIGNDSERVNL